MSKLITAIEAELFRKDRDGSRTSFTARGRTDDDVRPVMPYLNALYPKAIYSFDAETLHFSFDGRRATLRRHELTLHGLPDPDTALAALDRLRVHLNEVWEGRATIEPAFEERQGLRPLDLYQLLPLTNCRTCGEETCFSFAGKLAAFEIDVWDCEPLCRNPLYTDRRQALLRLVETAL